MEQRVSLFGDKEQAKLRSLKLVQAFSQVEICQFAVKADTYNFRGPMVSLEGATQACEMLQAIEKAQEILEISS